MSVPTERERAREQAIEAAREYLYRGGMHYQGSFHAFMGNPNTGLGGMIDLAEVLAFYALDRYDSGHKAGHDEAIERAAQLCTEESDAFRAETKLCSPESREFYDAKSRALINIAAVIRNLARQADSAEGK